MSESHIEYELQPSDRLCFIHTMKTGGTSLTAVLDSKFDSQEICPAHHWETLIEIPPETLATYRLLRGHFLCQVQHRLPQPPLFITLFRHPIDRIISLYRFWRRASQQHIIIPAGYQQVFEKANALSLQEFACDPAILDCSNAQTRQLIAHSEPDATPLDFPDLERAKSRLDQFTFVGLTDRFEESLQLLSFIFGWNPVIEHQPIMVAPTRSSRADVSSEIVEAIASRNFLDLALYEYAINLFEARYQQMQKILQGRYCGAIYEQLEQHYQRRQQQRNLPEQSQILLTFDRSRAGTGWHQREFLSDGACFCWTGPGTVSTIDLSLKTTHPLVLDCGLLHMLAPDVLESFQVRVNDQPVAMSFLSEPLVMLLRGTLTPAMLKNERGFVRLAFEVNRTLSWQSIEPDNPDHRLLGVAFRWLRIYPSPMVEFPADDPAWVEVANFLQQRLRDHDEILAPVEFAVRFPVRTHSYTSQGNQADLPTWVVLHKEMMLQFMNRLPEIRAAMVPVFANSVFVIFADANLKLDTALNAEHFNSFNRQVRLLQEPAWLQKVRRLLGKIT
jgi:hypothetical protein